MNGDRLSFTNRLLHYESPKVKMFFFHTHATQGQNKRELLSRIPLFPLPSQTYISYGRGLVLFHRSCFSRNTSLLCTGIVIAKLCGYLPSNLMLPTCLLHLITASLPGTGMLPSSSLQGSAEPI